MQAAAPVVFWGCVGSGFPLLVWMLVCSGQGRALQGIMASPGDSRKALWAPRYGLGGLMLIQFVLMISASCVKVDVCLECD